MTRLLRLYYRIRALLALALPLPIAACASVAPNWPELVKCSPDASTLVDVVARILLNGGDWQGELANLANEHGADTVVCIVDQLAEDWAGNVGASEKQDDGFARARAFLADTGTEVER